MRKSHRHLAGKNLLHYKKFLLLLPILAFFLLQPATRPSPTLPFSGDRRKPPPPPKLAYLISASAGEARRVERLVKAVYHPRNHYLLYAGLAVPPEERRELREFVASEAAFGRFGNVRVVEGEEAVAARGPTMVGSVLHAAALLLREVEGWSWFVNLDAGDYPLVSQDGMIRAVWFRGLG